MTDKNGLLKSAGGVALMLAGVFGLIFGRKAKTRALRITAFVVSSLAIGAGYYLLVDGISDMAIGKVGMYKVGGPLQQELVYTDKADFDKSISRDKDLRRLKFNCPDGSKSFTAYVTLWGVYNLPSESVVCADGFKLLTYKSK